MAEERLIDDDKDRKYKIRKNADGEDELIIDDTPDDEEESDIPVFNVPVLEEDDEEAALLTPEQQAERERLKAEEEAARAAKLSALIEKARENIDNLDFESAIYVLSQAEDIAGDNGEYFCLKLKALSRNFTDFISLESCAVAADGVREFAKDEDKAALKQLASAYPERIEEAEKATELLFEENELKKEERRSLFTEIKNKAKRNLLIAAAPFLLTLILTIVFSTIIFAAENGLFLILTITFAALTVVGLIFTLIALRGFLDAARNVKLNENDSSTRLGREYIEKKNELEFLKRIYSALDNDLY